MYKALFIKTSFILISTLFILANFACDEIIEKDISNSELELISPKDSLVTESSNIGFYWNLVDGATGYQLQVVTPSFDEIRSFIVDTVQSSDYYEAQLNTGDYEWRIKAMNNGYETIFTEIRSFTILDSDDLSVDVLSLISPAADVYFKNGEVIFRWSDLPKATQYVFELIDYPEFRDTVSTSSTTINLDLQDGLYNWRVKAVNDISLITSAIRPFNMDNTAPEPPLISIENGVQLKLEDIIEWQRQEDDVMKDIVEVASDSDFTSLVNGFPKEITSNSLELTAPAFTINTNYYMRIKSIDKAGNEGEFSPAVDFFVQSSF